MKKGLWVTGISVMLCAGIQAQDLTLDEIMTKHLQACKMDKRQELNTIVMTGIRVQQDLMPVKIYQKRPNFYLMEFDVVDLTAYQAYDGDTAWMTAPWTGNPAPRVLEGAQATAIIQQSDFDGILFQWKEKNYRLEPEGTDTLDSGLAYKIRLMQPDSTVQYYFIDAQDFLLKKRLTFRTYQGQQLPIETYFKDYRLVKDIPFAFLLETYYPGRSVNTEIETIELNLPLEDAFFRMREK